ncbi:MAG: restriction endonuclease [Halarcobacter ebronensis]|uniref:restriction endonuclease n=1 Tax=Halarcobacter ebronensis TaxID=1462615 RepID=UPI003C771739
MKLLIFILLIALILIYIYIKRNTTKKSHARRRKQSKQVLKKIRSFDSTGQKIAYLRKIDPFVFEEMILDILEEKKGISIIRNSRYTGDGGIDGRFKINNNLYLIQAKRYSKHIKAQDIKAFNKQIENEKALKGLFVHTGRTGKEVYTQLSSSKKIILLSGDKLISFLHGNFNADNLTI